MKFLCVACDEPMALHEVRGPDDGSMAVIYACPECGQQIAMLTNAMETQMVRSLGVKIGGRDTPAAPMENVRERLVNHHHADHTHATPAPAASATGASKCPFTGAVEEAYARQDDGLKWTEDAEERLARIPSFARSMVRRSVEDHARAQGLDEVDVSVIEAVKGSVSG